MMMGVKLYCLLLLAALSAVGCAEKAVKARIENPEKEPTQISIDLVSTESKNGSRSYRMQTPIMERYELATEPFSEFVKGILVETFNDTTRKVESDLRADYARFDEKEEIWEARGNVVGRNISGDRTIYTEQLFWNQRLDKIYTDKAVKVIDGKSTHFGDGFESDGAFTRWTFRNSRGQMEVKADSTASGDSTSVDEPLVAPDGSGNSVGGGAGAVVKPEAQPQTGIRSGGKPTLDRGKVNDKGLKIMHAPQ